MLLEFRGVHHRRNVWYHNQRARDEHLVTRLAHLGALIPDDDINGPRHGSSRHFILILLQPNFLPISPTRGAALAQERPIGAVPTITGGAERWHGDFELLGHTTDLTITFVALKRADQQLWFDLSCPGYRTNDCDQLAQLVRLQLANATEHRQVVEGCVEFQLIVLACLADLILQVVILNLGQQLGNGGVERIAHHHVLVLDDVAQDWWLESYRGAVDLLDVPDLHVKRPLLLSDHGLRLLQVVALRLMLAVLLLLTEVLEELEEVPLHPLLELGFQRGVHDPQRHELLYPRLFANPPQLLLLLLLLPNTSVYLSSTLPWLPPGAPLVQSFSSAGASSVGALRVSCRAVCMQSCWNQRSAVIISFPLNAFLLTLRVLLWPRHIGSNIRGNASAASRSRCGSSEVRRKTARNKRRALVHFGFMVQACQCIIEQ
mmetsp:Transcript_108972/g.274231  ORF Transcript_108972/g.274231 Transcript_108972/m.274231 type:complete len:432 (+) Transcript_108972:200-1495(+)